MGQFQPVAGPSQDEFNALSDQVTVLNGKITELTATATGSADGNVEAAIKAVRTHMKAQNLNEGVFRVVVGTVSSPLVIAERWASGNRIIGTIVYSQDAMYSFRINEADETITKYQLALNINTTTKGYTPSQNFTGSIGIIRSGYTRQLVSSLTASNNLTAGTSYAIATLETADVPYKYYGSNWIDAIDNASGDVVKFSIDSNGVISLIPIKGYSSGKNFILFATYISKT